VGSNPTLSANFHFGSLCAFVYYDRVLRTAHQGQQDVARLACAMAYEMGHLLL
jgi:hypothetical protein